MARRVSRASTAQTNPRPKDRKPASTERAKGKVSHTGNAKKSSKRALDAFAIAAHEVPDQYAHRGKRSRLGELEGPARSHRKRARDEDEEEDEGSEDEDAPKRRRQARDSADEGSDSEGNTWTMGHVDDDDDSDIDSDAAFGESDEERFEGWVFRGSESTHGKKSANKSKKKTAQMDEDDDVDMNEEIDLDEGESAYGEEDDESDWGDEAIDLATALDQYVDSEEEERQEKERKEKKKAKKAKMQSFDDESASVSEPSEAEDLGIDGAQDYSSDGFSSEDSSEGEDEDKKAERLKNLISSLPEDEANKRKQARTVDVHESGAPSEFGVMRKVDLLSFKPKITDPEKKKSLKLLQDDLKPSKRNDIARKLEAPLPKRQQDKIDRAVASEKANETLGRWVDTVKQNRRAEHLSFPLKSVHASEPMGATRLQATTTAAPANDLEATIQSILQQSGLSNGKDDEEQFAKWEELQTNKLPLEEVAKRRAMLRKERELMFREEVRAKRIKKIKSKAYRRVHRKEREKLMQRERDALKADGVDLSEDEKEYNDRRRAEERMGAKHRESRWAKGIKDSGRAAWDEDARAGVTEMARRNEELRRRIEGKEVRDEDEDRSDFSSDEEEDFDSDDDQDQVLMKQLGKLKQNPFSTGDDSKIGQMMFMQRAEAAKKARNDATIEEMRRELAGEEEHSSDEDENAARVGRKKFAPVSQRAVPAIQVRGEFEEAPASDDEESRPARSSGRDKANITLPSSKTGSSNPFLAKAVKDDKKSTATEPDALWKAHDTVSAIQERAKPKPKSKKTKPQTSGDDEEEALPEPKVSAPDADGWQTVTYAQSDDGENDDIENEGIDLDTFTRNQALTATAFAGDNVESEFLAEKAQLADEEASKTVTSYLPGWGSWTGSDLTSNQKKNRGAKTTQKLQGVDKGKRKDLRLEKVIVSEKKVKKNTKFLASQLPFPFESREQYERSLRVPTGPEWTTKMSHQEATKPRVMVKQGVIKALHKPLV